MPMTVSHAKSVTVPDWSGTVTVANSTGGTTTAAASDLARPSDWNSGHQVTFSLTGSEVGSLFSFGNGLTSSSNTSGITAGVGDEPYYEPFPMAQSNSVNDAPTIGSWYFSPFVLPYALSRGRINQFCSRDSSCFLFGVVANSTGLGGASIAVVHRNCLAIYSQGTGANVTRLETVWTNEQNISATQSISFAGATSGMTVSNYMTVNFASQIDTAGNITTTTQTASGTFSTGTTSMASTAPNSLITAAQNWFTGQVMDVVPFATSLPPGAYWMADMFTTRLIGNGTTSINYTSNITNFNGSNSKVRWFTPNLSAYKRLGAATSANSSSQWIPFQGQLATTTSQASSIIATSDLRAFSRRLYWNFVRDKF